MARNKQLPPESRDLSEEIKKLDSEPNPSHYQVQQRRNSISSNEPSVGNNHFHRLWLSSEK